MKQFVLFKEPTKYKLSNTLPGQNIQNNLSEFSFVSEIRPDRFKELSYPFSCKDIIIRVYNLIFKIGDWEPRYYFYLTQYIKYRSFNRENGVYLLFYNNNKNCRILENMKYIQDLERSIGITNDFTEIEEVKVNKKDFCRTYKNTKTGLVSSIKNYLISPNPFWFSSEITFRFFLSFIRLLANNKGEFPSIIQFLYFGSMTNISGDDAKFLSLVKNIPINIFENVLKYLFIFDKEKIGREIKITKSNRFENKDSLLSLTKIFNLYSKIIKHNITEYNPDYIIINGLYDFLQSIENFIELKKRFNPTPLCGMRISTTTIFLNCFARHEINKDIPEFKWAQEKNISKIKPVLNAVEPTVLVSTTTQKKKRTTTPATKSTVGTIPTPKKRIVRKKQVAIA